MKEANKYLLCCLVCLLIGFFLGRMIKSSEASIGYEKGQTIKAIVRIPAPYRVIESSDPIYLYKTDTINNTIVQKVDTNAIISDWVKSRQYSVTLFDDDKGRLDLDTKVQYNQLQDLEYIFTPNVKVVTKKEKAIWTPFISGSYNSLGYVGVGGGLFYHDLGFEIKYTTDFEKKGVDIGLKYKF